MDDLARLRGQIDAIDQDLVRLFAQRMAVTEQVGAYKLAHGMAVLDEGREREVLASKTAAAPAALKGEVTALFETIMALSRRQQRRLVGVNGESYAAYLAQKEHAARCAVPNPKVVYQGVAGAYAEEAAAAYFGEDTPRRGLHAWQDVFEALRSGDADYGVVPIENSSTGSINQVYDLLARYGAFIVGEVTLKVNHCLMAPPGVKAEEIQAVYSHEQGLRQCAPYLNTHPDWAQIPLGNTAAAAKHVAEGHSPCAAIASERCAKLYGLTVLERNIVQTQENATRFVVVAPRMELDGARDKISALFTLPHKAGTLHQIMAVFAAQGLNMMKLESRPIPEHNWEYLFFVDFSGNLLDAEMDLVLQELTECAASFRILGNYRSTAVTAI